jgi:hypothetical protein
MMKKGVFFALMAVVIIGLSSCERTKIINEPCQFNKKTIDMPIKSSEWKFDDENRQFYAHFNISALNADVYDYGTFSMYREYNYGTKDAYQVALPQSVFMTDTFEERSVVYYTQYIDYRVGIGYLDIQLTNSDYQYGQENPESMLFRFQAGSVTLDLNVAQADWEFDNDSKQYFYRFVLPEITDEVYNLGNWIVSREFNNGTSDAYQVVLPASVYMTDTLTNNPVVYYTQYVDYRVGVGYVEVQLTNSDHMYFEDPSGNLILPEGMNLRLQLMY